ncbi:permease [bacterium]|nr:permease [bacterium]
MLQTFLGAGILALTILAFLDRRARVRGRKLLRAPAVTPALLRAATILVVILSTFLVAPAIFPRLRIGLFAFCSVCPIGTVAQGDAITLGEFAGAFLLACWYYAATVIPVFIVASLLSGLLIAKSHRIKVRGILSSFALAAILPVCSCGVIPLAKTILDRGGTGPRDGLVFLATAPLLSPIIILLGIDVLGGGYVLVRIVASLILAVIMAFVVRPFLVTTAAVGTRGGAAGTCAVEAEVVVTGTAPAIGAGDHGGSVLAAGRNMFTSLIAYVLYGIVLGSLVVAAVPADYVGTIIKSGVLSLAAAAVVGVPINMCAGEEILLVGPLVGMGLSMGHAITFSLASTGICAGSLPLLNAVLGRRATIVMVAVYLALPFLLGLLINALPLGAAIGPQPF